MNAGNLPNGEKFWVSSGQLKETKVSLCSYETYETELLDRTILSLQKTEEAYTDVNNRLIKNVNDRKLRLNALNGRIQALTSKILTLY